MMPTLDGLLSQLKPAREGLLRLLSDGDLIGTDKAPIGLTPMALLQGLMSLPVSKLSLLMHQVWDFNEEPGTRARDIQGAKSRIDFGNYPNLNQTILFELKIAILCVLQIPGAMRISDIPIIYKPHTVLEIFKSTIPFIDNMCARKRARLGNEYFELTYYSLADFGEADYQLEAAQFERAFRRVTNQGFTFLRSVFLLENLFAQPLPFVDLESLEWQRNSITNKKVRQKEKFFTNRTFEKSARNGSYAVVDFLKALHEPVEDQYALERAEANGYKAAADVMLTQRSYDIYVAIRLTSRGYKTSDVEPHLYKPDPAYHSPQIPGMLKDKEAICKLTKTRLNEEFYQYITHINNSATYIVGQYTGMRPSELSGIMADDCLTIDEFGHHLILSTVIKNRGVYGKLFDDKWAAIPIVLDAVRTLVILNRFKRNPYLISNMTTVAPGAESSANSLSSKGQTHLLRTFLAQILTPEEMESLDVSTYTLRHTLANQMNRAAVGLPFISYQLKHFGNIVGSIGQHRASATTIDYGGIAETLTSGGGADGDRARKAANLEFVVNTYDPDGNYVGDNAQAHRQRLKAYFQGYLEQGYTKEEIFDRMVELDFAIINVGQGYCYGQASESWDTSLPCIGSLRCNPNRCKNAVVTKANAPKWREVVIQNTIALQKLGAAPDGEQSETGVDHQFAKSVAQMQLAISEAQAVLKGLGEEVLA